jgi:tetratricopeptide (TPR) repeat protein/TolB-like protein
MASLIPGYEYDIFISYRQKDNKGDRWVSEFVEALKNELESTFKEEISIYFDINPHDGLLETHDVDASLKEKLKCLVFIPILSRTYCDQKSFAWKNEFEAFTEQASKDQLGLKVKLPNGNIATRVLPVRIHDLDLDDIKLCESIIGGVLRDIEFIYKSEGVNRPLRSSEDKPYENLNNTFYRDQINKTALAIKEIILGLKGETDISVAKSTEHRDQEREFYEYKKHPGLKKNKILIGAGMLTILIVAVLFIWPGLIGRNNLKRLIAKDGRIPIAVMPFQNMTNDTTWNVWQDGVQSILINTLSNSVELKVRQLETITNMLKSKGLTNYASLTPSVAGLISKKLETNVHIQGSIKQSGKIMRLNAQLINTKTGEAFKSFQIEGTADSILSAIDSLSVKIQEFLLISVMKKELGFDIENNEKYISGTSSSEAFRYYMYGAKAFRNGDMSAQREWLLKALALDSNFVAAIHDICYAYANEKKYKQAKQWCFKAYQKRDILNMFQRLEIDRTYADFFETPNESLKYLRQMKEYDDLTSNYFMMGVEYFALEQYDKAIPEFEKVLEKDFKLYSGPWWSSDYDWLVWAYYKTGQYKKGKKLLKESEKYYPDDEQLTLLKAVISLAEGDTIPANRQIKKYISLLKENSASEAVIANSIAAVYWESGFLDKAEEYDRKALSLEPDKPAWMNILAYLLIDKDRNIKEGLELIDKALELSPDKVGYLDTRGWGLYKQGKYDEALKIFEKVDSLKSMYDHTLYLHLEAAKKAVAGQK